MKLSSAQEKVVSKLREGYELHRDMSFKGGYTLVNRKTGDWGRKQLNINTVIKLIRLGIVKSVRIEFPTEIFTLCSEELKKTETTK